MTVPTPDARFDGKRILVVGATSGIARSLAILLGERGARFCLAGRDLEELERIAADLRVRTRAEVHCRAFEAGDFDSHAPFLESLIQEWGGLDGIVVATGHLGDQSAAEADFRAAAPILTASYTGVVSLLIPAANILEQQRSGFIVALSSVAGDRGRRDNYTYASAKAGIDAFLQGLRARLFPAGVAVLTVKPGFVDTKMTFGRPGLFLVASPEKVARDTLAALEQGRDILYTPWFWRPILFLLRSVPESLFKRLPL